MRNITTVAGTLLATIAVISGCNMEAEDKSQAQFTAEPVVIEFGSHTVSGSVGALSDN